MDIKTRLENEDLFDSQNVKGKNRITSLNEHGIFTVEDFINCDIVNITKTSYLRRYYIAIQHALKYKYKGEPLVSDVLLDKEFEFDRTKFGLGVSSNYRIGIMEKLGFKVDPSTRIAKKIVENKMKANDDYYQHSAAKNGGFKQDSYKVSIIEILKSIAQSGDKLAQFYVEYKEKQELEEKQQTSSETLQKLKSEIVLLTTQRDELDERIRQLMEQVQTLEGGNIVNGRK